MAMTVAVRERLERVRHLHEAGLADRLLAIGSASGHQIPPARCAGEPAIAGSMCQRAGRPGWFRGRMVVPGGLVRNRRRDSTVAPAAWSIAVGVGPP
jgi:hypothetical protein